MTTVTGKFYSYRLDLDWLVAHACQQQNYVVLVHEVFARVLSLPVVTVTALQGHSIAAGAMAAGSPLSRVASTMPVSAGSVVATATSRLRQGRASLRNPPRADPASREHKMHKLAQGTPPGVD